MPLDFGHAVGAFTGAVAIGAAALLLGAATPAGTLQTLDVQRINVREPDGTLRMVLSSAARAPGIIIEGREQPHPTRRSAGMIFYNAEGTENGGLIFDGGRDAAGVPHSVGSLTFDRYKQDQVVQIYGSEDGHDRDAGLVVNDQPDQPMDFAAMQRAESLKGPAQLAAFRAAHVHTIQRAFVGRQTDGASEVVLKDASGVPRLRLAVSASGEASIQFLGKDGQVVRTLDAGTH